MNNREKIIAALQGVTGELKKELDFRMNDIEHEGEYDLADAFDDAIDYSDGHRPKLFNTIKPILISVGYCIPVDIKRVSSTGRKFWFKKGGIYYDCVCSWEQWINAPRIIYRHIGDEMNLPSTQEPRRVYDFEYCAGYTRFQALKWNGAYTLHGTKEELLKTYPEIKIRDNG